LTGRIFLTGVSRGSREKAMNSKALFFSRSSAGQITPPDGMTNPIFFLCELRVLLFKKIPPGLAKN
jgi:hypothetical protein